MFFSFISNPLHHQAEYGGWGRQRHRQQCLDQDHRPPEGAHRQVVPAACPERQVPSWLCGAVFHRCIRRRRG